MKKFVSILLATALLSACTPSYQQTYSAPPPRPPLERLTPAKLTDKQLSVIKRDVKESLKDPESAKFSGIIAGISKDKVVTVCGYINAKNSYGGYTGKSPFNGVMLGENSDAGFGVVSIANEDNESAVRQKCAERGLAL